MANVLWLGAAPAVAQINSVTPANVNIGNTFSVVMNGNTITFTATAATVANVTAGLTALLNASTIAEFAEVTWADATTHITGTADTAGVPFVQTSSASGGTATNTTATTTASAGPNDISTVANWSTGALPANSGDTVFVQNGSSSMLYGLNALSAKTLDAMYIDSTYTGDIGLPIYNTSGTTAYAEYRPTYLAVGITALVVGRGDGQGSSRIKINLGTIQTAATIYTTGSSAESDLPTVIIKGTHASNTCVIEGGSVGWAIFGGETATVATLNASGGDVTYGIGVTWTNIYMGLSANVSVQSAGTLLRLYDEATGTFLITGTGAITGITADGGIVDYSSNGTCAAAKIGSGALLELGNDQRTTQFTSLILYGQSNLNDPNGRINSSSVIDVPGATLGTDVAAVWGANRRFTVQNIP